MSQSDRPAPFRTAVRAAVEPRDCLGLATVPALLLVTFALPVEWRESLRFVYREPTVLTAYSAHFVHFDVGHLLANLLGYVLLVGCGYTLAALAGYRQLFGVSAVAFLVGFPPVLSALNLAVPRNAVGYGFSGMNMAFAGLLGLVLVAYGNHLDGRIRLRYAPGAFFAGVTLVSLVALPGGRLALGIAATSAAITLGYVVAAWRAWRRGSRQRPAKRPAGWTDVGVLGAVTFLGYQFVGFPAPTMDGTVVNLYVHVLGFCLGFIVPYAARSAGLLTTDDRGFLSD